jgi:tetratricopeptide (TPR) repeat protein
VDCFIPDSRGAKVAEVLVKPLSIFSKLSRHILRLCNHCICVLTLAALLSLSEPVSVAYHKPLPGVAQESNTTSFTLNKPVERELGQGESHSYQIALESGQYLRVLIDQRGIDVGVTLHGPDGQKLAELHCRHNGPTPVSVIAGVSGMYRLEVRSLEKEEATGRYEVRVEAIRLATIQDKSRIAAERAFAEGDRLRTEWTVESSRKGIEKYEEASRHWQATGDKREGANTLRTIGEVYHLLTEPQKALEYYNRALRLSQAIKDVRLEGEILSEIGYVHVSLGDNQKALEYCERALTISRTVGNRRGEAQALNNMGEVHYGFGNHQKAFDYYQQALPVWQALGDRRGLAQTLLYFGYSFSLNDPKKAFDYYGQALRLWRALNDLRGQAFVLVAIGHLHSRLGEKQKALDHYYQALPLVRRLGDRVRLASIHSGIGYVYESWGENERAIDHYTQELRIFQAAGLRRGETASLLNIGSVYYLMGEYQKALGFYRQALAISRPIVDKKVESITHGSLILSSSFEDCSFEAW